MLYEYDLYSKLSNKEQPWCESAIFTDGNWADGSLNSNGHTLKDILKMMIKSPTGRQGACANKNRLEKIKGLLVSLEKPPYKLVDTAEWMADVEESLLGIPLTCASVESCDISAANCTCKEFLQNSHKHTVNLVAASVDTVREIKTKRGKNPGQKMAFVTASDISGCIDSVIAWPDIWLKHKRLLVEGNHVMLSGEKGKDNS